MHSAAISIHTTPSKTSISPLLGCFMTTSRQLEVLEDQTQEKWCIPLKEDVFANFYSRSNSSVQKVFCNESFFSPFLFSKFFDPADAFPLWDFDTDILFANSATCHGFVTWFQTEQDYVLKVELPPGLGEESVQVYYEKGSILEISGELIKNTSSVFKTRHWKGGNWWEYGYVRRLELPADSHCKSAEAYVKNDVHLEIKVPKKTSDHDAP